MAKNVDSINVWSYLEEYNEYEDEISKIVSNVFKSGRLILGQKVLEFENDFATWVGAKYGTGVGNGTERYKTSTFIKRYRYW